MYLLLYLKRINENGRMTDEKPIKSHCKLNVQEIALLQNESTVNLVQMLRTFVLHAAKLNGPSLLSKHNGRQISPGVFIAI
jgi:hypothetical protein